MDLERGKETDAELCRKSHAAAIAERVRPYEEVLTFDAPEKCRSVMTLAEWAGAKHTTTVTVDECRRQSLWLSLIETSPL